MRSTELHRWLDRTIGIPLIAAVSAFRRWRALPASARRIAILQPTAIGDTLITSGIPAAVLARFPDAHINILHGPSNASAIAMIDADFTARTLDFRRPDQVVRTLRSLKSEIVIDLSPWPRLTALCAMASGAVTIGYDSTGQGRGPAFDIPVEHRGDRHELENAAAVAAVFAPDRPYKAAVKAPVAQADLDLPFERLVLFHTTCGGSRRLDRAWTVEKWTELARRLGAEGYVIGFSGVKAEIPEIEPLRIAASAHAETLLLAGRLSLPQFTHVLASSRALISLDTGAVHIGSCLNAPVVGLYGPARALRWGPWSSAGVGIDSPHPSAGYSIFGFETSPDCRAIMEAISVQAVYEGFQTVVRPLPPSPPS
jgi:ADP-heptose:LPS heptosyltransferase